LEEIKTPPTRTSTATEWVEEGRQPGCLDHFATFLVVALCEEIVVRRVSAGVIPRRYLRQRPPGGKLDAA
jgi:hypothetical protein